MRIKRQNDDAAGSIPDLFIGGQGNPLMSRKPVWYHLPLGTCWRPRWQECLMGANGEMRCPFSGNALFIRGRMTIETGDFRTYDSAI